MTKAKYVIMFLILSLPIFLGLAYTPPGGGLDTLSDITVYGTWNYKGSSSNSDTHGLIELDSTDSTLSGKLAFLQNGSKKYDMYISGTSFLIDSQSLLASVANFNSYYKFWKMYPIMWNTQAGTKPSCSATYRGLVWFTAGGSGVKDSFEICAKDASNSYAWRTLY